jgi:predicted PhzF superfamily epimerase YddE/YHI9
VPTLHVLRVFTTADGAGGNELGLFPVGSDVPEHRRQDVARDLGFAETVFVDDPARGEVRIFAPDVEMPFAGHPTVGTAWFLRGEVGELDVLRVPAGDLALRFDEDLTWVAARPEWSPPFEYVELGSPAEVDALQPTSHLAYCWAWLDEGSGRVRARSFVPDAGIPEDEATGSAALALCARLGRSIEIVQGAGSELFARPLGDGRAEVGGRTVLDRTADYAVEGSWV